MLLVVLWALVCYSWFFFLRLVVGLGAGLFLCGSHSHVDDLLNPVHVLNPCLFTPILQFSHRSSFTSFPLTPSLQSHPLLLSLHVWVNLHTTDKPLSTFEMLFAQIFTLELWLPSKVSCSVITAQQMSFWIIAKIMLKLDFELSSFKVCV